MTSLWPVTKVLVPYHGRTEFISKPFASTFLKGQELPACTSQVRSLIKESASPKERDPLLPLQNIQIFCHFRFSSLMLFRSCMHSLYDTTSFTCLNANKMVKAISRRKAPLFSKDRVTLLTLKGPRPSEMWLLGWFPPPALKSFKDTLWWGEGKEK